MGSGDNEGGGGGGGAKCPGILFSILWFFGIFILAWPIAGLIVGIYLLLSPLAGCIPALRGVCKVLLGLINFPYMFGRNVRDMAPCNGESWRIADMA